MVRCETSRFFMPESNKATKQQSNTLKNTA